MEMIPSLAANAVKTLEIKTPTGGGDPVGVVEYD
jgi:hypothetical protein